MTDHLADQPAARTPGLRDDDTEVQADGHDASDEAAASDDGEFDVDMTAVGALADVAIHALGTPDGGVHIDTVLAGTAATAGAMVLRRAIGPALESLPVGSPVFTDRVDEAGPGLLGLAQAYAESAGIVWDVGDDDIPSEHEPHRPHIDLVAELEPLMRVVLVDAAVPTDVWAEHVLLAAVDLLIRARAAIDPTLGTRIITWGLVIGSKTVPAPLAD